jgi:uncharacterized membrane protein
VPALSVLGERLRSRLWPIPAAAAAASAVLAALLSGVRPDTGDGPVWWPGEPSSARGLLETLAGSSLTVVALVFSLQVVALQLAASQYSPRLLRTYARDGWIQGSLAVLLSTFVFCVVTLALFGTVDRPPRLSVAVAVLLGLAAVGALVGVVAHIVSSLRVETMMAEIHGDAEAVVEAAFGADVGEEPLGWPAARRSGDDGCEVRAERPGFVQAVDRDTIATWAQRQDCYVRLEVSAGWHVLVGDRLGRVWPAGQDCSAVRTAVLVGYERTPDEDPGFGLVQLVDIALRALSPSVNDPTTAVHALGHLASLLGEIATRASGPVRRTEAGSTLRVVEPVPALATLVADSVRPVARASGENLPVLLALLDLLAHVAGRDARAAGAVSAEVDYVTRRAQASLTDDDDRAQVLSRADAVTAGLRFTQP